MSIDMSRIEALLKGEKERQSKLTSFQKAVEKAAARRSWVVGEMMLSDPELHEGAAIKRYNSICPEGMFLTLVQGLMCSGQLNTDGELT